MSSVNSDHDHAKNLPILADKDTDVPSMRYPHIYKRDRSSKNLSEKKW